jgi:hypothetical protein
MNSMQKGDFCRWTGRILGIILVPFIVVFFVANVAVGQGPPNPFTQPVSLWFHGPLIGTFLMVVGTLVGWRWEFAGDLTALIGLSLVLVGQKYGVRGMPLFLGLPGILYLVSVALRRLERRKEPA